MEPQRTLGCPQPESPADELFGEHPGMPAAADEPGVARLVHQIPNAKNKTRLSAVRFFAICFTALLIAPDQLLRIDFSVSAINETDIKL